MAVTKPILVWSFAASVDLSAKQFTFVQLNSAGELEVPTAGAVAFALDDTPVEGESGTVVLLGVAKVTAGGAIVPGAVTTTAAGLAIQAVSTDAYNGYALTPAASGDVFPILVGAIGAIHA